MKQTVTTDKRTWTVVAENEAERYAVSKSFQRLANKAQEGKLDCTCTVTKDGTTTDPKCSYHGDNGSMVIYVDTDKQGRISLSESQDHLPKTLVRIDQQDAMIAMLRSGNRVRGGFMNWIRGAPTHVLAELLNELEVNGYYIGVNDNNPFVVSDDDTTGQQS